MVRDLLTRKGINVEAKDSNGYTALMRAADFGSVEVVDTLLTDSVAGAHVMKDGSSVLSALHCAAIAGHSVVVRKLLEKRPEERAILNQLDANRQTILTLACEDKSKASVITELIKGGADTSIQNGSGVTPLAVSIHEDNLENVKAIVAADIESLKYTSSIGGYDHTPLWLAVANLDTNNNHGGRDGKVVVALLNAARRAPRLLLDSTPAIRRLRRSDAEWDKHYSKVTKERRRVIKDQLDDIDGVLDQIKAKLGYSSAEGSRVSPVITSDARHSTEFPLQSNTWERAELEPGVSDRHLDRGEGFDPQPHKTYYGANHPNHLSTGGTGATGGIQRSDSPKRRRAKQHDMLQGVVPPQAYHHHSQRYPNTRGYNVPYERPQAHPPSLGVQIPVPKNYQNRGGPSYMNSIPFEQVPRTLAPPGDRFFSPDSAHAYGGHQEEVRPRSSGEGYYQSLRTGFGEYHNSQYLSAGGNLGRAKSFNDRSRQRGGAGHWGARERYGEQLDPGFAGRNYPQQQLQPTHPQPPNAPLLSNQSPQCPGHFFG